MVTNKHYGQKNKYNDHPVVFQMECMQTLAEYRPGLVLLDLLYTYLLDSQLFSDHRLHYLYPVQPHRQILSDYDILLPMPSKRL